MSPGLLLHARSRGLYSDLAVLTAIAVLAPLALRALGHAGPEAAGGLLLNLVVMTTAVGVARAGQGLAGADPELEGSVPRIGPGFRLAHLAIAQLAVGGLLVLGFGLLMPDGYEPGRSDQLWIVVRDTAGLFGLTALASAVLGARFSPAPAAVWVLALTFTSLPRSGWRQAAAMPKSEADVKLAALVAIALLIVGATAYTARRISR